MFNSFRSKSRRFKISAAVAVFVLLLAATSGAYAWYYRDRVIPNTFVGAHNIGGLTQDEVAVRMEEALSAIDNAGIQLGIDGSSEHIQPETIAFDLNLTQVIEDAFKKGHSGSSFAQFRDRVSALWNTTQLEAPISFDEGALSSKISEVARNMNAARRDVRLQVSGTQIDLSTDTSIGRVIDEEEAGRGVRETLALLSTSIIPLELHDDPPRADPVLALSAVEDARAMVARAMLLSYEDMRFTITRDTIAGWLVSEYENDQLKAGLDETAVSAYVATVAKAVNIEPEPARITTSDDKVTGFTPPTVGRAVEEEKLQQTILDIIRSRTTEKPSGDNIVVPLKATSISLVGLDEGSGISELVGKAATRFTGSPKNRISNIKNGVKHLTGSIIPPGGEFSTLSTLGTIDSTTGYLPELVIKGDRTKPEFGGGLCQVSTTLFRAVMDAGLPITMRQNHSFRVSYYEKDEDGKSIGPGLDATIYEPRPDFKFVNDTSSPLLIIGYVSGDKITFEFYGTKDGRKSSIDGPHTLTTTPAGTAIMIPEPSLAVGVKKQVETAHAGGSAVATYSVEYADGTKKVQEFKSWYRPWPAQFLVGTGGVVPTPTPTFPVSPPLQ